MISNVTKGLLSTAGLLASSQLFAWGVAPADPITIKDISYNGSGCPIGTVAENVAPDKQAFTLTFAEYIAESAPYLSLSDARKNCQLTINLNVPQGWQFSIASFDYRGFAYLEEGMKADYSTSYYFQGGYGTGRIRRTAYGYFDDIFQFRDQVGLESLVWSPCGVERALNVNTSVFVRNADKNNYPDSEGIIGTDSIDGQIRQVWGIKWRRCS